MCFKCPHVLNRIRHSLLWAMRRSVLEPQKPIPALALTILVSHGSVYIVRRSWSFVKQMFGAVLMVQLGKLYLSRTNLWRSLLFRILFLWWLFILYDVGVFTDLHFVITDVVFKVFHFALNCAIDDTNVIDVFFLGIFALNWYLSLKSFHLEKEKIVFFFEDRNQMMMKLQIVIFV